jgi:hypothetical protein
LIGGKFAPVVLYMSFKPFPNSDPLKVGKSNQNAALRETPIL